MTVRPTPGAERILALDVLRGFALYGVFVVNASVSARPFREAVEFPAGSTGAEQLAWVLLNGLFVTKFVALFSFLFGIGLVLQCRRIEERGDPPRLYLRRLAWLALLGALHGCLLFEGDILLPYAVAGCILYWLRARSAASLARLALAAYVIGLALDVAGALAGPIEDAESEALAALARESGSVELLLRVRVTEYLEWLWLSSLTHFNWQVLALFFLGAAAMKQGWLESDSRRLRRTAVLGLGAGACLELVALVADASDSGTARVTASLAFALGSLGLASAYAAGVVLVTRAGCCPRLVRALAAVGRTALTNYVAQSLLMNVLFLSLGFGLWNELTRWQVFLVVSLLFVLQVVISVRWLQRFPMGPLEWLWRRLTYGPSRPT